MKKFEVIAYFPLKISGYFGGSIKRLRREVTQEVDFFFFFYVMIMGTFSEKFQ